MLGGLGEPWIRAGGYAVAAALCAVAGWRDVRRVEEADRWPAFWFGCAGFFAVLAVGRARDWGDLVSEIGRRDARAAGWYEGRREVQALVVCGVIAVSGTAAVLAAWQVLRRGRVRYLPLMLVTVGLGGFVSVRLASLHQIDAVLHNRSVDGLQIGAGLELLGIGLAVVLAVALASQRAPASGIGVAPAP